MSEITKPTPRSICNFKISKIIDHTKSIRELYLELTNYDEFNFKAGQFVMLQVPVKDSPKPALRAYSIASTDQNKKGFKLIFKFVEAGLASNYIWNAKENDILNFTGPFGKVVFQEPPTEQVVFLNTGSGISQHFSFIESFMNKYPHLKYRLYFGVRTEDEIYYQSELERLKKNLSNFEFYYVLSRPQATWTGKKGYIQNFLPETDYKNTPTTFYMCGNGAMIKDVKHQLIEVDQIPKDKIWAEAFD